MKFIEQLNLVCFIQSNSVYCCVCPLVIFICLSLTKKKVVIQMSSNFTANTKPYGSAKLRGSQTETLCCEKQPWLFFHVNRSRWNMRKLFWKACGWISVFKYYTSTGMSIVFYSYTTKERKLQTQRISPSPLFKHCSRFEPVHLSLSIYPADWRVNPYLSARPRAEKLNVRTIISFLFLTQKWDLMFWFFLTRIFIWCSDLWVKHSYQCGN